MLKCKDCPYIVTAEDINKYWLSLPSVPTPHILE